MKFTNHPYLDSLKIIDKDSTREYTNLSKYKVQCLCATYNIDLDTIVELVEGPNSPRVIIVDLEVYHASKKENEVNSNIGSEIVYVTPAMPRLQSVQITKENIIQAAQWCGATEIRVPSGPEPWGFYVGRQSAIVGDVIVRDPHGNFEVMDKETFFEKYEQV